MDHRVTKADDLIGRSRKVEILARIEERDRMHHAGVLEHVRNSVKEVFAAQGLEPQEDICETILIRDGFYCGRSFSAGNLRAVWFLEENLLKYFHQERGLLFTHPACVNEYTPRAAIA